MKKIRNNHLKKVTIISLLIVALVSCTTNNESKKATVSSHVKVEKPNVALHEAILKNDLKVVKQHILSGTNLNEKEAMSGSTPLMTAITFNKLKIVDELIKANADLTIRNNDGGTALHTAAFFGRIEMVKMLLEAGADKTAKDGFGATPREIVLAEFNKMKPVYEMLILQLQPMGFSLDLMELEKARPVVAMMLQ